MIQLCFATNIQMVDVQPHLLESSSSALSAAISFLENTRDNWGRDPVFNYLQVSPPLQSLWCFSLSAWPFVSSVDLVMISVTDQSPLAEIWGHSGSWECCTEEFDVCTAICNGSSPLVCLSMHCIYPSTGLAVIQSTGLSISVRQFVGLVHEWSQVHFKFSFHFGNILGDKRSLMRHFCTVLLSDR